MAYWDSFSRGVPDSNTYLLGGSVLTRENKLYSAASFHQAAGTWNAGDFLGADGVTINTAAMYAAMPAKGGTILIPPGEFVADFRLVPGNTRRINVLGSGIGATVLRPVAADTPVFGVAVGQVMNGQSIGGFSIKAHAGGSTGAAIMVTAHRGCKFHDIGYESNAGANFAELFRLGALGSCYANRIERVVILVQTGPGKVLRCVNAGTLFTNPNINYLDDWFVYANVGITAVIDAGDSTLMHMSRMLLESNPGAIAIIPGSLSSIEDAWLESNGTDSIKGFDTYSVAPSDVYIRGVDFSGAQTVTIPNANGWVFEGCAGSPTIVDGGTNNVWRSRTRFDNADHNAALTLKNTGAGGGNYSLIYPGTGSSLAVGSFILYDNTTGRNVIRAQAGSAQLAIDITSAGVNLGGTTTIGGGTGIKKISSGVAAVDPGSIAANTRGTATMTVTGAAVGDVVILNMPSTLEAGLLFCGAYVSAADTVTVVLYNATGAPIDGASIGWRYEWHDLT
jgi:hypothetical protein